MLTIKQARKLLGKESRKRSDQEIEALLNQVYLLAEIAADSVLCKSSKGQPGVIDSAKNKDTKWK